MSALLAVFEVVSVIVRVRAKATIRGQIPHNLGYNEVTGYPHSLPAQKAGARKHQSATALSDAVIDKPADRDASTRETRQAERSQNQISKTSPDLLSSQKPPYVQALLCSAAHDG